MPDDSTCQCPMYRSAGTCWHTGYKPTFTTPVNSTQFVPPEPVDRSLPVAVQRMFDARDYDNYLAALADHKRKLRSAGVAVNQPALSTQDSHTGAPEGGSRVPHRVADSDA